VGDVVLIGAAVVLFSFGLLLVLSDAARGDPPAHVDLAAVGVGVAVAAVLAGWPVVAFTAGMFAGWHLGAHRMARRVATATSAARIYDQDETDDTRPLEES
jgi:hypothetical protein